MAYVVEVDQSVRVEDSGDSFLAFSDGTSWAIKVPFKVKRAGFQTLSAKGKSRKQQKPLLFAACVFLLVKDHLDQIQQIIIDNEYDGHQGTVKGALLRHIRKHHGPFSKYDVVVRSIGKKSPAHKKALAAKRGRHASPDRTASRQEIEELLGK